MKYFEFSVENYEYYALISARSRSQALSIYMSNVADPDDSDLSLINEIDYGEAETKIYNSQQLLQSTSIIDKDAIGSLKHTGLVLVDESLL